MNALVQIFARGLGTVAPELATPVVGILSPHLVEGGNMIRRVGKLSAVRIGSEGDEFVLDIDERRHVSHSCLLHRTVENVLCLGEIVDARVVAPEVRGEDERGDEIQLAVRCSTL